MPSQREDYLLRLLHQVAERLRRLRDALTGGASPAEIDRDADAAIGELLGPRYTLLSSLDAKSAAALIADPRRMELWVGLIRVQAAARRRLHDEDGAATLDRRADSLEQESDAPGNPG